jgi:diguanylate cyclase (GGDEF)-like protein
MKQHLVTAQLYRDRGRPKGAFVRVAALHEQGWWVVVLTALLLLGGALPAIKFFSAPSNYLPLHTGLEFISIAVSAMVFALAWNLHHHPENSRLMLLGIGFLAVGLIDFAHTLSFAGMPDWITPSGPEKAINFWLAGRYVLAFVLLGVALHTTANWSTRVCRAAVLVVVVLTAMIWWIGLIQAGWLPHTFLAGRGLTGFKVGSEYLVGGLYGAASVVLFFKGRRANDTDLRWLAAAAWVLGLAEMFFTLYADVTDLFNLLGHVYKVVAYLMVYRAVFSAGVHEPYRKLQEVHQLLKETEHIGKVGGWEFNMDSGIQTWTDEVYAILEVERSYQPTVANGATFFSPASRPELELAVQQAATYGESFDKELEVITGKGHIRCVHVIGKADRKQRRVHGFIQDITEHKRMEEQVRQLAFYDVLTGLPNRRLLVDRLNQTMATSKRSGLYCALMFLDLDNFKPLNDAHGHDVGDLLLVEVARRLSDCVREADTVARFGGDEFVVMLCELDADRADSMAQAHGVAEKMRLALSHPYQLAMSKDVLTVVEHHCSASIGVVVFINHEASADDILKWSDAAMYRAKKAGSNRICFYEGNT